MRRMVTIIISIAQTRHDDDDANEVNLTLLRWSVWLQSSATPQSQFMHISFVCWTSLSHCKPQGEPRVKSKHWPQGKFNHPSRNHISAVLTWLLVCVKKRFSADLLMRPNFPLAQLWPHVQCINMTLLHEGTKSFSTVKQLPWKALCTVVVLHQISYLSQTTALCYNGLSLSAIKGTNKWMSDLTNCHAKICLLNVAQISYIMSRFEMSWGNKCFAIPVALELNEEICACNPLPSAYRLWH